MRKLVKTLNDSNLNFKYSTLEKATGSFDDANKLGQGGFGTVYKVILCPSMPFKSILILALRLNCMVRGREFCKMEEK